MRLFLRFALAVSLASAGTLALAQESIDKGDLNDPRTSIDSAPVSVGDVPGQSPSQGRVRISNVSGAPEGMNERAENVNARGENSNGENGNLRGNNAANRNAMIGNRRGPVPPLSDFQRFVWESTGKYVPFFGAQFFEKGRDNFAPSPNAPVASDYTLGTGDEVLVRGWGTIDIDYRAFVDREGLITIPSIGSVVLGGLKASDAEGVVRAAVNRLYKGVTLNVSVGRLRSITVYVVGQANSPGTYTVSSTSTLVTALFASGGPSPTGSMRHVQLRRGGKLLADLDLYAFIAKGDKSTDVRLVDGDTIFIPPAAGYVALVGTVNNPAIYELKNDKETVASMMDVAGGVPVVADPRRVFLERIDPSKAQPRTVVDFALDAQGMQRTLKDGDVLNLASITPDFANAVTLRGNVDQAIRVPYTPGMRISNLIPSREFLITRDSVKLQNGTLLEKFNKNDLNPEDSIAGRIGGLIGEINWDYAVVERIDRQNLGVSLLPFNLGNVFSQPSGSDDLELRPGDTVTVFSQKDVAVPIDRRRVFVRIEGEINVPGVYQMKAGETLQTLLARAGGPTENAYLFGTAFYREQVRKEQKQNLEKAARRLEMQLRNEQSTAAANTRTGADAASNQARRAAEMESAREAVARLRELNPSGRIAFGLDPNERSFSRLPKLKLENGDRLVVPAKAEFVHVFGAVNAEASPLWKPNGRVADYLKQVGMTPAADEDNIFILRVDGSVVSHTKGSWLLGGFGGVLVMPGDSIVVPEKFDKESAWTKFTQGTREWAQIFANFGLGAAAIKTLRD